MKFISTSEISPASAASPHHSQELPSSPTPDYFQAEQTNCASTSQGREFSLLLPPATSSFRANIAWPGQPGTSGRWWLPTWCPVSSSTPDTLRSPLARHLHPPALVSYITEGAGTDCTHNSVQWDILTWALHLNISPSTRSPVNRREISSIFGSFYPWNYWDWEHCRPLWEWSLERFESLKPKKQQHPPAALISSHIFSGLFENLTQTPYQD